MASLDSAHLKVKWAYQHLRTYESAALRYFDQNPGEVVSDTESDPNGRVLIHFKARIPVPDDVSLIIGDAIQNLRSALDYLVWELVCVSGNQPTDKNMFPICDSPESFDEQCRRHRLDGVPIDAIAEIKALQPYHYGDKKTGAPIRVIDDFCNINKHRRILITVLAAHASHTEFISTESGRSFQQILSPRYDGAELAVGPIPSREGEKVEVKGGAAFFVTFNEGAAKGIEVSTVVNQLWHFVDKIVFPKFERFF